MSNTLNTEINGGSCGANPNPPVPMSGGKKKGSKSKAKTAKAVKKNSKPKTSSKVKTSSKSKRTSKPKVSSKKASSKKTSSKKMSRTVNVDMMNGGAKKGSKSKKITKAKVTKTKKSSKSNSKKVSSKPTSKASGILSRIISANGAEDMYGGKKSSKGKTDKPKRKLNEAMQATLELNKEVLKRSGADRSLWFGLTPYINTFRLKAKEQIKDHKDHKAINKLILELIQKEIDTKGKQKVADEISQRNEDAKKKRLAKKK